MTVAGLEGDSDGLLDLLVGRLPGACVGETRSAAWVAERGVEAQGESERTEAEERELCAVRELESRDSLDHDCCGGARRRGSRGGRGDEVRSSSSSEVGGAGDSVQVAAQGAVERRAERGGQESVRIDRTSEMVKSDRAVTTRRWVGGGEEEGGKREGRSEVSEVHSFKSERVRVHLNKFTRSRVRE